MTAFENKVKVRPTLYIVVLLITCLTSLSCSGVDMASSKTVDQQRSLDPIITEGKSDLSPLDEKALEEAQKYFKKVVSNCDGYIYTINTGSSNHYSDASQVTEFQEVRIKVEPEKLDEADVTRNDIRWRGDVIMYPKFFRRYDLWNRQWKDFQPQPPKPSEVVRIRLTNKGGVWDPKIRNLSYGRWDDPSVESGGFNSIRCEDLPWKNLDLLKKRDDEVRTSVEELMSEYFVKCDTQFYYTLTNSIDMEVIRFTNFDVNVFPRILGKVNREGHGADLEWRGYASVSLAGAESCPFILRPCKQWSKLVQRRVELEIVKMKDTKPAISRPTIWKRGDCRVILTPAPTLDELRRTKDPSEY